MSDALKVSAGKPKIGGAIYSAPLGTTLPTDATTELDAAFKSLGYVSEDGVSNASSPEIETLKAWGGDSVLTLNKGRADKVKYKLIEALNEEVIKAVYGEKNVTGTVAAGLTITVNSEEQPPRAYVIDMILKNNTLKRIVIPNAQLGEVEDIVYADNSEIGYGCTLYALPDAEGQTHYEYIKAATAGG